MDAVSNPGFRFKILACKGRRANTGELAKIKIEFFG